MKLNVHTSKAICMHQGSTDTQKCKKEVTSLKLMAVYSASRSPDDQVSATGGCGSDWPVWTEPFILLGECCCGRTNFPLDRSPCVSALLYKRVW